VNSQTGSHGLLIHKEPFHDVNDFGVWCTLSAAGIIGPPLRKFPSLCYTRSDAVV